MIKEILSVQNSYIKSLLLLQEKSKTRHQSGTFLIEGKREIELAVAGNYQIETVLFCTEYLAFEKIEIATQNPNYILISKEVYQKLAYRDTTEGVLAIAKMKITTLLELKLPANPLILVMESIEKPGNIGAMLRTADAAKVDAVILANPKTDLYNPNIIRSSVGCLFTNQIATGNSTEIIAFLQSKHINIFGATLQNSTEYDTQNFKTPTALVVGTEAVGLSQAWRAADIQNIMIPMQGFIDSMNVSVAAAILIFEAKRQRKFA